MDLKQKIIPHSKYWDCHNDCPYDYDHSGKLVKIVEEFAIGFWEWRTTTPIENIEKFTNKELIKIYRKENEKN